MSKDKSQVSKGTASPPVAYSKCPWKNSTMNGDAGAEKMNLPNVTAQWTAFCVEFL